MIYLFAISRKIWPSQCLIYFAQSVRINIKSYYIILMSKIKKLIVSKNTFDIFVNQNSNGYINVLST